jgi:hypothetical protein
MSFASVWRGFPVSTQAKILLGLGRVRSLALDEARSAELTAQVLDVALSPLRRQKFWRRDAVPP